MRSQGPGDRGGYSRGSLSHVGRPGLAPGVSCMTPSWGLSVKENMGDVAAPYKFVLILHTCIFSVACDPLQNAV